MTRARVGEDSPFVCGVARVCVGLVSDLLRGLRAGGVRDVT